MTEYDEHGIPKATFDNSTLTPVEASYVKALLAILRTVPSDIVEQVAYKLTNALVCGEFAGDRVALRGIAQSIHVYSPRR